jgi:aminopeptidase N/puromycin-sensitive aminopeptidase
MRKIFLSFLLCGCSLFAQRLPQTVIPNHYHVSLDPSIEQEKFSGAEVIDVFVKAAVTAIVLNSVDLDISEAEVVAHGQKQSAKLVYDKPDEVVRLELSQQIPAGPAKVRVEFSGKLTDGLRGLYLSSSSRRKYAVTQFEGTYARMMFPCFDEPDFKAMFDLSVTADKGDTAISNGRIVNDEPLADDRHRITFSESPKMSTYLVALAIGDWQCLSRTIDEVPIRVCAVPEKKEYGAFALDVASHSIQFYDQWYGIKYPFGKLDMLAIPDYEWGGMENTASIFYRDSALLFDEKSGSSLRKRGQAVTIAHEIAHQWFGDLVTPVWWDDIWLNEGFATWMSAKPIEAWHPEWHLEEDVAAQAQQIIGVDSLSSARAIHGNPSTPPEIKEMFDGITYEKGAAVIRMLESYIGPEVFRKGVNAYLAAHADGNATSADFWQAEAQVSGKPVDKLMPTFVVQPGVPEVSISNACAAGISDLRFNQKRFLISGENNERNEGELWQIPVCVKTGTKDTDYCTTIVRPSQPGHLSGCPPWVFGNANAAGYYRVEYTSKNLQSIAASSEKDLTVPERIALVEDTWAMTRAGKTSIADFLDFSQQLRSEQNRRVVESLAEHLDYIRDSLVPNQEERKYDEFVRQQFQPLAKQLGWASRSSDADEQKALRATLLDTLGSAGDEEAVAAARKLVEQYMQNPSAVDGTISSSAFSVAAENADQALYQRFFHALAASKSSDEYYHYLYALTDFRQPNLLARTLQLVDQGKIRQQDYPRFFGALLSNPAARNQAWEYLKDHWDEMSQKVTSFGGAGAVSALGNACDAEMRDDIRQFFADHPAPGAQRAVQQSLERITNCVEFKKQQSQSLQQWLSRR